MNIQILANIIISFAVYLLVLTSFSLIYYPVKIFHIAHASVMTMSAYCVYIFTHIFLLPYSFSISAGIIFSSFAGAIVELLIYRPMRKKNLPVLSYLIVSLGIYIVLQNLISLFFGDETKVIGGAEISHSFLIFGAYITYVQILIIFLSLSLFIFLHLFFRFTATGKSVRAVSSNPELCNIYGISSNKIILIAFAIGSALAGVAGILSAMDTNMTPTFGFNLLLYGVVAMIIGGVGSTRGLLAGSLLVATAQHLAAFYLDTKWMDAVTYIILILFLIWKPLGFSGNRLKKVEV
jgi:branched-chain amino acid transport system permease protein